MGNQKRKAEAERKRQQHHRAVTIGIIAVVVIAAAASYFLFIRKTVPPVETSANAAAAFAGGIPTLVYANFDDALDLHRLDLTDEKDEIVLELPRSGDTRAAPGSTWLSIQVSEDRAENKLQPVIYAFDTDLEQEIRLGVGFDPMWSADGGRVAWNQPADEAKCREGACGGDISIVVTDPSTGETTSLTEPGPYRAIGWAGDYVIIEDDTVSTSPVLQSVSPQGQLQELPIRPIDYWGASPDGRWVVQSGEGQAMFFELADGQVAGSGAPIGIPDGSQLGSGAWAHDSSYVAAFAVAKDDQEALDFVTFRPNAPDPVVLTDGGQASTGIALWAPDNDAVIFQRFNGEELEAVYCRLDSDCSIVLTWTRGRSILRIE